MRTNCFLIILWVISCAAQETPFDKRFGKKSTHGFLDCKTTENNVYARRIECADRLHDIVKSTAQDLDYRPEYYLVPIESVPFAERYRSNINATYKITASSPQEVHAVVQELIETPASPPLATLDFLITRADGSQPIRNTFFNEQGLLKQYSYANKNIEQHPEACRALTFCALVLPDPQQHIHQQALQACTAINEYLSSDELPGPPGSYASVLYDLLRTCHPELETTLQHECDEVATIFLENHDYYVEKNTISDAREQAAKIYHEEHGTKRQHFVQLHATSRDLLRQRQYDYRKFTFINGNALQRQLLDETGQLINQIARYPELHNEPITHLLVDMADVAAECNHAGAIKKGYECANVGWYILDIMQAVGLGIIDGVIDGVSLTASYALEHPIELILTAIFTKPMLIYHLTKLACYGTAAAFNQLSTIDYEHATADDIINAFNNSKQACLQSYLDLRQMPLRTLVSRGVAFATEFYLQGKLNKGVSNFYEKTQETILKHAQKFDWKAHFNDHLRPGFIDIFPRGKQPNVKTSQNYHEKLLELEIQHPVINSPRTGKALKTDPYHAFNDIIDNYARYAQEFELFDHATKANPKLTKKLYQIEGSLDKVSGIFEWIVEQNFKNNSVVSHRRFIKEGKINGIPNGK